MQIAMREITLILYPSRTQTQKVCKNYLQQTESK